MDKILLSVFVVLAFALSFLPQDAHATTVYTLDQSTCGGILYPGSWDATTNTCTLTGIVNFGTNSGPHVLELVIPSGNTLTISSNHGFLFDFDTITNNGTINLVNSGGLAVTNGGVLNNNGIINNNGPYLQNGAGTINNNVGATINNNGRFTNYFAIINNRGVLNAGSDLENQAGGIINNLCPGVILGTIIGQGGTLANQCNQLTSTDVSSSQNPSTFGQSVTFTATISPVPDGGSVQFQANGTNLGSPVSVSSGTASASTSSLAIGHYTINALYSGTANFATSTGTLSQTVNTLICLAGSFLSSNSCIPAPPGSYVPLPGATSATLCPVGTFTSLPGQTQCTPAPAGSYVPSPGATSSLQCTSGSFQPNPGSTSCNPSDPGNYVSGIGSISETQCSAGSFQPNYNSTSCIPAPSGSFVDTTGATSSTLCPIGSFTNSIGQALCTPSPAGSFVDVTGATSSNLCPVGQYQPLAGQSSCIPAPTGSFVDLTGATSANLCPIGKFTNSTGQSSCTVAPAGSFVNSTGATSATLCLPGTFNDLLGQSVCLPAPPGSFATGPGATLSEFCLPGSYQPLPDQTSCLLADPGFYVSSSGAIQQTQCPAGQSSNAGATSCFVVDIAPPTISITQPTDGSVLNHISSINGTASDDTSVSSVIVSVDGGSPQSAVYSSGTWTLATTLPTGMHTANATATDSVGHKASTGITHFTILASTQGRVTGGGHIGQDQNFGFEVKSDDDGKKSLDGHLEYHDKTTKIDLDSNKITALSVYDSSKHAVFIGQGQIHDKDKTLYGFFVQVYDADKSGDHDTFSIAITDSNDVIVYQNSGTIHGHIEIHKFADKDDKSDSGIHH